MDRGLVKRSIQTIFNASFDDTQEKVLFIPVLYDPVTQSVKQEVNINGGLPEVRFSYDSSGIVEYLGKAAPGTATSSDWLVYKFSYDSDGNCIRIQNAVGSWDNRSTLF